VLQVSLWVRLLVPVKVEVRYHNQWLLQPNMNAALNNLTVAKEYLGYHNLR
jgi:hypothetical protein